jgi:hypothetical protein
MSIRASSETSASTISSSFLEARASYVGKTQNSTLGHTVTQAIRSPTSKETPSLDEPPTSPFLGFNLGDLESFQVKLSDAMVDGFSQDHNTFDFQFPHPELPSYYDPADTSLWNHLSPSLSRDWTTEQSLWDRTFGISGYAEQTIPYTPNDGALRTVDSLEHFNFGRDENFFFGAQATFETSTVIASVCCPIGIAPEEAHDQYPKDLGHHNPRSLVDHSLVPLFLIFAALLCLFNLHQFRRFVLSCCQILSKIFNLRKKDGMEQAFWTCCDCGNGQVCPGCGHECCACEHERCHDCELDAS